MSASGPASMQAGMADKGPPPAVSAADLERRYYALERLWKDCPAIPLPKSWIYDKYPGVKDNRATDAGRGTQVDVWALEQSIERGYAVATFYSGDIDPDQAKVREGFKNLFQGRDHFSGKGGRIPASRIQVLQDLKWRFGKQAGAVGGPVQAVVVKDNRAVIAGQGHIELYPTGACGSGNLGASIQINCAVVA